MADRRLTLGTAGHIDHGKTVLVEALTGKNTDRLAEEQRRGISIELGFAELRLDDGLRLSVVDVPGHERLVRTMVAGATGIDLFLMVIAADDGVMPQTREHAAVLRGLGVGHGVIALTKCDVAAGEMREAARVEAAELLPGREVVEVSARTGDGLDRLRSAIAEAARAVALSPRCAGTGWPEPSVMHVDRAFTLHGIGTVVTGTLRSGTLGAGDRLAILPAGTEARARSVQVHDRDVDRAVSGARVAVNLAGIRRDEVARGDVLASADAPLRPSYRLDVELLLERDSSPIGRRRVQVHHGTRDVPARVVELDAAGLAQLRLEAPLIAMPDDRVVIRSIAPPDTLGGGVVIDPRPPRRGRESADRLLLIRDGSPEELLAAAVGSAPDGLRLPVERLRDQPLVGPALERFAPERWREAIERLCDSGRVVRDDGLLVPPQSRRTPAPERPPAESKRAAAGPRAIEALRLLERDGIEPRAPQALADAMGIERQAALAALDELVGAGDAVRLTPGVYYPAGTLRRLTGRIVEIASSEGSITIAEVRDALGTSRKYAQALLEHLDAEKVTIRHGDRHVVRASRAGHRR